MSASCVYAAARSDHRGEVIELADVVRVQAPCRVEALLARLSDNTDAADRVTAHRVLGSTVDTFKIGISHGDDPVAAVRTARMVHAYETTLWNALAQDID